MNFLFFLLFIVIIFGIFILMIVAGFLRNIFKLGRKMNPFSNREQEQHTNNNPFSRSSSKKKVFEKTEGEYVEYEEMKD